MSEMTLEEAKQQMRAQAASLASLARAGHVTYVGAENSIAACAERLTPPNGPDYSAAWKLYDYGIEQFRAFHKGNSQGRGSEPRG